MLRRVSSGSLGSVCARWLRGLCCAAAIAALAGCGDEADSAVVAAQSDEPQRPAAAPAPEAEPAAATTAAAAAAAPSARRERPLPAFGGWTLDGKRLEISSLLGKRAVVFFFNPEVKSTEPVARAVAAVAAQRAEHNFEIVGVAVGSNPDRARAFLQQHRLEFPVIDDSSARIASRFGLRTPLALLGVDAEGYVVFGLSSFPADGDAQTLAEKELRSALRLPSTAAAGERNPLAPTFVDEVLDGDAPFDLAQQRGRPVLLLFFLHTCPHCHEFLEFAKEELAKFAPEKRPVLVGVELTGRTYAVRDALKRDGLDFFPVLFDRKGEIREAYGVFGAVPDVVLIDASGRIAARSQGFSRETDAPLLRMRLAKLAGTPVPMLLRKTGFSGNEACGICHEAEHATWQLTTHAGAFDTLVRHGSDSDAECVACHVVGFQQAGGYEIAKRQAELEDVGCESCHGRGGPHLSPGFVEGGDYSRACATCHDEKHSLGFAYPSFLPRISHAANAHLLTLPAAERERMLAERGAVRSSLLPTAAKHVGSEACRSCHPAEHERWAVGPHAAAFATLEKAGHAQDAKCVACHTTGFGRPGGFPKDGKAADHPDLARVGCESCHGPGGDHVAEGAPRRGNIVSLGDKCDSCVILQICGSCHDDANDPGFEFEVLDKIEATRHGTIEAGTGRPLPKPGASARTAPGTHELLAAAFAAHAATEAGAAAWTPR
jgi:peroxiredoxin